MGTYTYYQLKSYVNINAYPADISSHNDAAQLFKYRSVEAKWYKHREDLIEISKINPNQLIVVECASEDGEYWKIWCKDGKLVESKGSVVFEEKDISCLFKE